jgi:hypothetical protein
MVIEFSSNNWPQWTSIPSFIVLSRKHMHRASEVFETRMVGGLGLPIFGVLICWNRRVFGKHTKRQDAHGPNIG